MAIFKILEDTPLTYCKIVNFQQATFYDKETCYEIRTDEEDFTKVVNECLV